MANIFNNSLLRRSDTNIFNNSLLKRLDTNRIDKIKKYIKIGNIIIVDSNISNCEKLNAKIININNSILHVRYFKFNNEDMLSNDKNILGLDKNIYNLNDYNWIEDYIFIDNGLDRLVDIKKENVYKPYSKYPYYCNIHKTLYGNRFVFEYYNTIDKLSIVKSECYNNSPSTYYNKLPKIIEKKINIKDPVRIFNEYKSIIGCIIKGLPRIIKNTVGLESNNLDRYYSKYIKIHMNKTFIKYIEKKYDIPYENIIQLKNQLKNQLDNTIIDNTIIDNFLLSIICSEIFQINIKIYKYNSSEDIDMYDINDKELITLNIYNIDDIYEPIISKNFIIER